MKLATEQRLQRTHRGPARAHARPRPGARRGHRSRWISTRSPPPRRPTTRTARWCAREVTDENNADPGCRRTLGQRAAEPARRRRQQCRRAAASRKQKPHPGNDQLRDLQDRPRTRSRRSARSSASPSPCWSTAATARRPRARPSSTYQPRDQKEMEQITALVRSAIGFDAKRGDQVEVINLRLRRPRRAGTRRDADKLLGFGTANSSRRSPRISACRWSPSCSCCWCCVRWSAAPVEADGRPRRRRAAGAWPARRRRPAPAGRRDAAGPGARACCRASVEAVDELIDIDKVEGRVKPRRSARSARSSTSIPKRRWRSCAPGCIRNS